jgi:hypothetical protein
MNTLHDHDTIAIPALTFSPTTFLCSLPYLTASSEKSSSAQMYVSSNFCSFLTYSRFDFSLRAVVFYPNLTKHLTLSTSIDSSKNLRIEIAYPDRQEPATHDFTNAPFQVGSEHYSIIAPFLTGRTFRVRVGAAQSP